MDQAKAARVLKRFDSVVKTVARQVAESFPSITTTEDAEQDARILLLSYAGLVPGGRHVGTLDKIAVESDHDEQRMRNVLTTTLRLDLVQDYGREADKRAPEYSLNNIPESKLAPIEMNSGVSEREWLRKFPHLAARVLYGMTEDDMATAEEVSRSTIARRIATEKRQFLVEYITKGGLVVEGDETIPELQEAYGHLKAAGR